MSFGVPKYFGESILFLSVISNNLIRFHRSIIQAISPSDVLIKKYFELDDFVPHLTLGKEHYGIPGKEGYGLSKQNLKEMEELTKEELTPYPSFEVNVIRIYELNIQKQRYEKYLDVPL